MQAAAERCLEFMCARFSDPVYFGDYPQSIRDHIPALPVFTKEQQAALKGSVDFFLVNHYSTKYIAHKEDTSKETGMDLFDGAASVQHTERGGTEIGPQVSAVWLSSAKVYCRQCVAAFSPRSVTHAQYVQSTCLYTYCTDQRQHLLLFLPQIVIADNVWQHLPPDPSLMLNTYSQNVYVLTHEWRCR